jgi:uncharacterized protein (TIRG00374 family)
LHWGAAGLVALALLGLFLIIQRWRQSGFDWTAFADTFRRMNFLWLAGAAGFVMLTYVGRVLRWRVMLLPIRPHPGFWNLFTATAIGFTAMVLFGRPGEFVRPYLIAAKEDVPFSSQLAAWFLERVYDLLIVLLMFGYALTRVDQSAAQLAPRLQWVFQTGGNLVGIACTICLLVLFLMHRFGSFVHRRLMESLAFLSPHHQQRIDHILTAFLKGMESTRDFGFVLQLVLYTLLEWLLILACFFCLFRAFPATAAFKLTDVLIYMGFVVFGSTVQIPGVGGGMQIVSAIVLTELFGMSLEVAAGLSLMVWLTTFVIIVPVGLLLAFHEGINWKKLRTLQKEART